ncbi:putative membrane protein [Caldisphaera lagunensis DSM 15908]|uniref:Putative membrane protein n=1 Tax=Caldisphaera lagunensis (strain DSM 15908 / JCM 11604 / ANMR 0165 / IC-154) TaxID=1056495 RepID=L0A7H6_CALLD|nr:DUF131 domain-containing protein [Caldisphaera lagunensis]AFZ69823.1 putative membrane protein [Caldisphaera lagunensis DSM 15908]
MPDIAIWLTIGIALIMIGFLVILIGTIYSSSKKDQTQKSEVGGVIMIGPIPIIFGNSWRAAKIAIILAIILITLAIVFMLIGRIAF